MSAPHGIAPALVSAPRRWRRPVVQVTCPCCGVRADRKPWQSCAHDGGVLVCTFACDPRVMPPEGACLQLFEVSLRARPTG